MIEPSFGLISDVAKEHDYRDVQALGQRIGVELPDHLIKSQERRGYPCRSWSYALHELGHLVLDPEMRFRPHGTRRSDSPVALSHPLQKDWDAFQQELLKRRWYIGHLGLSSTNCWCALPSEWTVQSWCFEVARALGWLPDALAEEILESDSGLPGIRMFWGSYTIPLFQKMSLLGESTSAFEGWTLRQQHALQVLRLKDYGVDFAAGQLVPTVKARQVGPYIELVDPLNRVRRRIPATPYPEGAPLWWALWNWFDVFGDIPPGLDPDRDFRGDTVARAVKEWTEMLTEALVSHAQQQQERITEMLHSLPTPAA